MREITLLALTILAIAPAAVRGQMAAQTIVAEAHGYPAIDADVLIVRQPGQDAIVFRPGAVSTEGLRAALFTLKRARTERPSPTTGELIPVLGFDLASAASSRRQAWLERVLADLAGAPVAALGSFGPARSVILEDDERGGR